MRFWGRVLIVLMTVLFLGTAPLHAADYRIGGKWLTEGGGFIEKGIVRVGLTDKGWLQVITTYEDGVETITGYEVYAELEASRLDINAWQYKNQITLGIPIPVKDFNPSMSDPFKFPPITFDDLTYTLKLTSVHSGTLKLSGYVDIDSVGRCEVSAENALWKDGTPKPAIPDRESGCSTGALPRLALITASLGAFASGKR